MAVKLATTRKRPVFYGWNIVAAGFVADMVNAGVGAYLLGVLLVPMQQALHTSRTMITLALTIRQMVSALISPFAGPLVDKKNGAKWLMAGGGFFGGLGLILTGLVNAPWQFLLAYGVVGGLGVLSSGFLVTSILLAKWFIRLRGRATAIANMGVSTGGLVMIPLGAFLIDAIGWRAVWIIVGFMVWVLILPVALFIVRTRPEDMGLRPDGEPPEGVARVTPAPLVTGTERPTRGGSSQVSTAPAPPARGQATQRQGEAQWTRREALRTPTFWLLIIAFDFGGAELSGLLLHQKAYLQEHGLSSAMAAAAFTAFAWGALAGKPFWGYIIDKVSTHRLLVSIYVFESIGIGLFLMVTNTATGFLAATFFGLAVSGVATMQSVTWANYYGRDFLGSIRGLVAPFQLFSSVGGPLMAAAVHDATNSYTIPFFVFLGFAIAATIVAYMARPPTKRPSPEPAHI